MDESYYFFLAIFLPFFAIDLFIFYIFIYLILLFISSFQYISCITTLALDNVVFCHHSESFVFSRRCLRRVSSSSVELESEGEEEAPCSPQDSSDLSSRASTRTTTTSLSSLPPDIHNPWLQQCHQTTLHKLKQKTDSSNVVGEEMVSFFSLDSLN